MEAVASTWSQDLHDPVETRPAADCESKMIQSCWAWQATAAGRTTPHSLRLKHPQPYQPVQIITRVTARCKVERINLGLGHLGQEAQETIFLPPAGVGAAGPLDHIARIPLPSSN